MNRTRRDVCRVLGTSVVFALTAGVATAAPSLEIDDAELPDTITIGGTFSASLNLVNTGDERVSTDVQYSFDGNVVAETELTIDPEEQATARLPDMKHEWLGAEPGVYVHSIGVPDGPTETREVEIVEQKSDSATDENRQTQTPPEGLRLVSRSLPERLHERDPVFVGARVENTRSETATFDISYRFENQRILFKEGVTIPPGEDSKIGFENVTAGEVYEKLGDKPPAGTYDHSFGLVDGPRIRGQVTIGTDSTPPESELTPADESGDSTSLEEPATPTSFPKAEQNPSDADQSSTENRERGFLSNSGDEPEYLSNPLNLTTLGFLLSVGGILHQLFNG